MQELQFLYQMTPDENGHYFTDEEIQKIMDQMASKPMIYIKPEILDTLDIELDITTPIGMIDRMGVVTDPVTGIHGLALIFQLREDIVNKLSELKLVEKIKIQPYIVGELLEVEDYYFVTNPKLANIWLVID